MAKAKVLIGCKLPHGLILEFNKERVKLSGLNSSQVIRATHVVTEVDADFWEAWKLSLQMNGKDVYAPLIAGAIFECKNETEVRSKVKELENEKTGFEPMLKAGDPRMGSDKEQLKPADKD